MFNAYFSELNTFPTNIQLALVIIFVCVFALALMYVYLVVSRIFRVIEQKRYRRWHSMISQLFAEVVSIDPEEHPHDVVQHLAETFKTTLPFHRPYIKLQVEHELVHYHASFTGKTAEILRQLYLALQLDALAYKRLNDSDWEVQVYGIKLLAQLSIREAAPKLLAFTDDEIGTLRMEAQAAFLKLSDEHPFRFLDRARERILDWHQLVLIDVITKSKNLKIPSFSFWLNSKNDTVVLLCLKLIRYYQQFEAISSLTNLLNHSNEQVRLLAIDLLGQFEAHSSEQLLVKQYKNATQIEKSAIIKALGQIASGQQLDFLLEQVEADSHELVFNSLRAIQAHGLSGERLIQSVYNVAQPSKKALIDHLLDPRLR